VERWQQVEEIFHQALLRDPDVAPDGQRFLVNDLAASPEPLNVIVNWPALLKEGAAAP